MDDDTKAMQKLIDGLVASLASNKNVAKHSAAAVKAFVDFQDDRRVGSAAYNAAPEGALTAVGAVAVALPRSPGAWHGDAQGGHRLEDHLVA